MQIKYFTNDIDEDTKNHLMGACSIAIDTECMGLNTQRDRLCVVQLRSKTGAPILVHFPTAEFDKAIMLKEVLASKITKIFHFGRFDLAAIYKYLNVLCTNVYCTKIASYIARTYTRHHSLKELCKVYLNVSLCKTQQISDWGFAILNTAQKEYAASDVLYLHDLKERLEIIIKREKREHIATTCMDFLPGRAMLDVEGWADIDLFAHTIAK